MLTLRQEQMVTEAQRRCATKRQYAFWDEAEYEARELIEDLRDGKLPIKKGLRVQAYRCLFGEHWHIGHQKPDAGKRLAHALQELRLVPATTTEAPQP